MTTPKKTEEVLQKEALTVLVQWRSADAIAARDKRSRDKQRAEYAVRQNLRTAADCLTGVKHGR